MQSTESLVQTASRQIAATTLRHVAHDHDASFHVCSLQSRLICPHLAIHLRIQSQHRQGRPQWLRDSQARLSRCLPALFYSLSVSNVNFPFMNRPCAARRSRYHEPPSMIVSLYQRSRLEKEGGMADIMTLLRRLYSA